ncbi:TPA: hypothetical protein DIC39_03355 [Patescibacteria group bacterium]|nr:hypothetical protein [Patescibacteria group bacterium]
MNANSGLPEAGAPGDASADSAEVMADTTGVPRQARDGERSRTISPWRLYCSYLSEVVFLTTARQAPMLGIGDPECSAAVAAAWSKRPYECSEHERI